MPDSLPRDGSKRPLSLAGGLILGALILSSSLPALAGSSGETVFGAVCSTEAIVAKADAGIERAIDKAQFLAAQTPRDDATIAAKLVDKSQRIVLRTEHKVGSDNVELYTVYVEVGSVTVEVDPMKVAGE